MTRITLKGNPISTNGELPKLGSKAPDFSLVDRQLKNHSLKDFLGKKKIVITVPSLDTGVCSLMTKKMSAGVKNLSNIVLIVVSADLPFAQDRFCTQEGIDNVTTLSMMRSKDFAKDYGILIQDGPLAGLCARSVIVLDEQDKVLYTELVSEIIEEPNYESAMSYLKNH